MWPVAGSQPERRANWSIATIYLLFASPGGRDFFYYALVYYGNSSSRLSACSSVSFIFFFLVWQYQGIPFNQLSATEILSPFWSLLNSWALPLPPIDGQLSIAKLPSQSLNHNQSRSQSLAGKLPRKPREELQNRRQRTEKESKKKNSGESETF